MTDSEVSVETCITNLKVLLFSPKQCTHSLSKHVQSPTGDKPITYRPQEPLSCGETCGELIYLLNLRAPVHVNLEINLPVAKIKAK